MPSPACTKVFEAPEAAARAAAAASNKKRGEAEAAITEAVSEALFMMYGLYSSSSPNHPPSVFM
jgi:ribosomal RNA-processing protein 12